MTTVEDDVSEMDTQVGDDASESPRLLPRLGHRAARHQPAWELFRTACAIIACRVWSFFRPPKRRFIHVFLRTNGFEAKFDSIEAKLVSLRGFLQCADRFLTPTGRLNRHIQPNPSPLTLTLADVVDDPSTAAPGRRLQPGSVVDLRVDKRNFKTSGASRSKRASRWK